MLLRYLRWIEFWKKFYKPESVEEEWHPLFVEALQNESKISYLVDMLMFGTDEEVLDFSRTEGRSFLVICQENFEIILMGFPVKRAHFTIICFAKRKNKHQFDSLFGLASSCSPVYSCFGQQSKNESYKFTRCKCECSLVLMLRNFSIFFSVIRLIFRNMTPDTVSCFTEIVPEIAVASFGNRCILGLKSPESLRLQVKPAYLARASEE